MTIDPATRFPRTAQYSNAWITSAVSGGANPLWLTEWLTEVVDLRPGQRVLDLGCGRGLSSIFLHREFGVQVWAADLWFSADERQRRIEDAGVEANVYAIHADARQLPFPAGFFDVVVSIDSYSYYGTDDLYLGYLSRFLTAEGLLGIAGAGLAREAVEVPEHLQPWWEPSMACLHSADWWRRHWDRSGLVCTDTADTMTDGWQYWLAWQHQVAPDNATEIDTLDADAGQYLAYVRATCRRLPGVQPDEPLVSLPTTYSSHPVLR
jgi:cyclopropane fatty-acyl-phospholipid synthase-like methyltransferase